MNRGGQVREGGSTDGGGGGDRVRYVEVGKKKGKKETVKERKAAELEKRKKEEKMQRDKMEKWVVRGEGWTDKSNKTKPD